MKKSGLKDMKSTNRRLIVKAILEDGPLSRIELAQKTELSPSTVSGIVSELLEGGMIAESGVRVTTAGRSRTELTVNGAYGAIAVVDIARHAATLHLFDMALHEVGTHMLPQQSLSGNDLIVSLTAAVFDSLTAEQLRAGMLKGVGLLFQEDVQPSECNVIYSTGFSSASISLREALITQFRTPVVEEFSQSYTLTQAITEREQPVENSAHISLGSSVVLAGITLGGQLLPLRGGSYADITPLLEGATQVLPQLTSPQENVPSAIDSNALPMAVNSVWFSELLGQLCGVITTLCTLFPLDVVFLSGGSGAQSRDFLAAVERQIALHIPSQQMPRVESLRLVPQGVSNTLAQRIRAKLLCT